MQAICGQPVADVAAAVERTDGVGTVLDATRYSQRTLVDV